MDTLNKLFQIIQKEQITKLILTDVLILIQRTDKDTQRKKSLESSSVM